ncbi:MULTISPECIES: type VII secretion-associated serine protease mycosin [Actinokineospora]|uniref:Protease n=1 Tax=Actinokineospora fastidiosa TaxID=1816 RepID=A0A918GAB3_9PSEU|nr:MULTISPECIES: type VII secretion-associated serine protease mycosin [Actinokineospora]UVS82131.1 Thermostable alkaline protease precursor [Actinokineospora sp. UTMC 2448]GGS23355.1 putative protease [Actinokineospora fastidiosa]
MRRRTRIPALALAAGLALAVPVQPAVAQEPTTAGALPPPLPPGTPIPGGTDPNLQYNLKTQCIRGHKDNIDIKNKPWGQSKLQFDTLHKFATGKGVKVAVIDTGVSRHPYLGDRLQGIGDYVKKEHDGLEDCDGHGTMVAGIIAAKPPAGSDIGFMGIAPDATILSIRQSSANYTAEIEQNGQRREVNAGNLHTLAQAVVLAANSGADVINMSVNRCRLAAEYLIDSGERELQAAMRYAVDQKDVVLVTSAGNTDDDNCPDSQNGYDPNNPTHIVTPPWFRDDVLSVAAVNRDGDPAPFTVQGPWVSVSAPGTDIISLDPSGDGLANLHIKKEGEKSTIQGTSFAAPYVAGLAALIRERYDDLSARQVMERIRLTASHPAAPGGHDNLVGHGMINPIGALTAMIPAEQGIPAEEGVDVQMQMPPAVVKDWTPMHVALIGAGGGLLLLLITLFVVHTVRRNRPELRSEARGQA